MKKVLVLFYSQTGQLKKIVHSFVSGLQSAQTEVEIVELQPKEKYPFPWTSDTFFGAMPDSVLQHGTALETPTFRHSNYDLVVFAYQPWFLSPSIPATAILQLPEVKARIYNTPIVTIIGARNMWLNAQEKVKTLLKANNAHLVANAALVDKAHNLISVLTVMRWMFEGKQEASRWLPASGVSEKDIREIATAGTFTQQYLQENKLPALQQKFIEIRAVEVDTNLMFVEKRAGKLFSLWANFIHKQPNKIWWSRVFKWYLIIAIFLIAPIVLAVYSILFKPFLFASIHKEKEYYLNTV
ncbi:MAG: hypothetical protein KF872_04950 [Chitinophagales bacterium]|nr:hypothetical protein [Chitinophagales bacterium]